MYPYSPCVYFFSFYLVRDVCLNFWAHMQRCTLFTSIVKPWFTDKLEKQLFIKKTVEVSQKKKINIYHVAFLKKIKKNTWRYHYFTPVYQKSWWYDLKFLRYRAWQSEIGNFRSYFALLPPPPPPKNPKNQNFAKMKKITGDIIILKMCIKNLVMYGSWVTEWDIIFCYFGSFFALLPPWKNEKNTCRYYRFT